MHVEKAKIIMKTRFVIFLALLLSMIVASCNTSSPATLPLNRKSAITVSVPPELNTYKLNDFVTIVVQNNSNYEIAFLPQDGITLFMKSGDRWINIENLIPNSLDRKIILSPQSQTENSSMTVDVVPKASDINSVIIRIWVVGKYQSTSQKVEGYVDVTLYP